MRPDQGIRPLTTVVLAMSADGKIADASRSQVMFGSPLDRVHLEKQVAAADGILFGTGTLKAGGTAMRVTKPELLQEREYQGKPPQPVQILCSRSAEIDPELKFFQQPVPRWLLTTTQGAAKWQEHRGFEKILTIETPDQELDLPAAFQQLKTLGLNKIAILGGGAFIASLFTQDLIDELWLTVCPLIIGGTEAPTPVDGKGYPVLGAPRLELLKVKQMGNEVFLHYRRQR